jgi:hypothetical protein
MLINSVLPGGGTDRKGDEATEVCEAPRPQGKACGALAGQAGRPDSPSYKASFLIDDRFSPFLNKQSNHS